MDKTVKLSGKHYDTLRHIAETEGRKIKYVLECALMNYFKAKKVLKG